VRHSTEKHWELNRFELYVRVFMRRMSQELHD